MDDKQLVQQAAAGDTAAFETLVERYQQQVYHLTLRMVGNDADAQDLAQEAFVRAWRGLGSFQFTSQFSTWLYRLTSNICIDFLRAQKRRKVVSLTMLQDDEDKQWELPDGDPLPEQRMIDREEREALGRAFRALDPDYRQVLWLLYFEDMSHKEAAAVMGRSVHAAETLAYRARAALKQELEKEGIDDEDL